MPSAKGREAQDIKSISDEVPRKRVKLLLEDDTSSNSDFSDEAGGVALGRSLNSNQPDFKINEEYARRFVHNQRRAELHRLEEKYGKKLSNGRGDGAHDEEYDEGDSSTTTSEEEEDEEGVLALGTLDEQVNATLEAIRKKDPRVYDESVTFYTNIDDEDVDVAASSHRNTKPMYLTDYHRENLLKGDILENNEHESEPTYAQQQDELKNTIVKEIHAAAEQLSSGDPYSEDDKNTIGTEFLVTGKPPANGAKQKEQETVLAPVDIENADQDPETFLSKFMAAKAWVPVPGSRFQPFESDNEEEERQAEAFEEAYNLRFENPQVSNEKLMSHARDTAARYSVRKEHVNSRKRARETEQSKKEMEKIEREQEKARFRKLKLEEVEEKINKIKLAAGLNKKALDPLDWSAFLTEDWDDERWEAEMQKRFGETYYAKPELDGDLSGDELHKKRKVKKPKWDDDIDITDLVPDFHEEVSDVHFSVSGDSDIDEVETPAEMQSKSGNKSFKRELEHQRREARRERRKIEQMVDEQINVHFALEGSGRKDPKVGLFRYRETSPVTYGLTTYDILMADDSQLNQYAGLKKLAPFRDPDKKRRDKKRLGKKARLRQWRKETFGSERGPTKSLQDLLAERNSGRLPRGSSSVDKGKSDGKRKKGSKKSRKDVE